MDLYNINLKRSFSIIFCLLLCIISISYCFFGYHNFLYGLSIGIYFLFFQFFITFVLILNKVHFTPKVIFQILTVLLLISLNDFILNESFNLFIFKNYISAVLIFSSFYFYTRHFIYSKFLVYALIGFVFTSFSVAILQTLDVDMFWEIRNFLPNLQDPVIKYQITNRLKSPGLAYYSVNLSYQLFMMIVLFNFYVKNIKIKNYFNSFTFLGSIFIGTFSITFGFIIVYLINKSKFLFLLCILIALPLVIYFSYTTDFFFSNTKLSRLTFFIIGLSLFFAHPFGSSKYLVEQGKLQYSEIYSSLPFSSDILNMGFHNAFLSQLIYSGIQGFLLFVILLYLIFRYLSKSNYILHNKNLFLLLFVVFTLVQSLTHNSSPLTGDPFFWITTSILLAQIEKNNYKKKKNHTFR